MGREVLQSLFFLQCGAPNLCFSILYRKFFNKTSELCRKTVTKMILERTSAVCCANHRENHLPRFCLRHQSFDLLLVSQSDAFGKANKVTGCQGRNLPSAHLQTDITSQGLLPSAELQCLVMWELITSRGNVLSSPFLLWSLRL